MNTQQSLFSASILLLVTLFYSTTTTSAQVSPVHPPISSPPSPTSAQTPGFNTIPLVPVSPTTSPSPIIPKTPSTDILQILTKAKKFSILIRLLKTTQLINQLNSQLITSSSSSTSNGLTLFAPEDSSFIKLKAGFLNSLSDKNKVELLQFHTLSSFISITNFDTLTNPVQTQAGDGKRLQLNVTTYGGSHVSLTTGAVNATVTGTVYADNKLAVYEVDKVLLPLDLVLPSKALAPAPVSKGGSVKPKHDDDDDKSKSSTSDDGDDSDDDGGSKDLPSEASAAADKGMWQFAFVVGVALLGEAIILS